MTARLTPSVILVLAFGLLCTACGSPESRRVAAGRDLFDRECARCHGGSRGEPASEARFLAERPPDLTRLTQEYGSPLPRERLAAAIDGRAHVEVPGSREMPVWGEALYDNLPDTAGVAEARAGAIELLLDYLESVQVE